MNRGSEWDFGSEKDIILIALFWIINNCVRNEGLLLLTYFFITFKALNNLAPCYIDNLRSTSQNFLAVSRVHTKSYDNCTFLSPAHNCDSVAETASIKQKNIQYRGQF